MKKLIAYAAIAVMMGTSAMTTGVGVATAQDLELEIGRDGPRIRLRDGECDPEYERCRDDRRDDRREVFREDRREEFRDDQWERREERRDDRRARRVCTEDRALDKAERMGIRRARIVSVGRRSIEVRGRDRSGSRVIVSFGRDRSCPILG